mgnify:FL=1
MTIMSLSRYQIDMSVILREGDKTDVTEYSGDFGSSSFQTGASTGSASNVFIGGIGVVCAGDASSEHCNNNGCHSPIAGDAGANIFVGPGKKPISTIDTPLLVCLDGIIPVVGTVFAG